MDAAKDRVMTVKEVSQYLRCHTSTVYRFVFRGDIPHFRIGSDIRVLRSDVDRWISKVSQTGRAAERSRKT